MSIAAAGPPALLVARDLSRTFGPTRALKGASLVLHEREVHVLAGTSGAGKSTLLNILSGLEGFDAGEVAYRGYPIKLRSRRDALRIGIAVVAQEPTLVPDLTVLENLAMPAWGRIGRPEPHDLRQRAGLILDSLGFAGPPGLNDKAHRLSASQARLVEIARGLARHAKLYLFDEPFASLAAREADTLVGIMNRLRLSGCGILVAGRALDDLLDVADRVSVLCEGRTTIAGEPVAACDRDRLRAATGADTSTPTVAARAPSAARPRLAVDGLVAPPEVRAVSFSVAPGSIHGLYGMKGAGLGAALHAVAGLRGRQGGGVRLDGKALPPGSAKAAASVGLAIVTADSTLPLPRGTARDNLRLRDASAETWPTPELWRAFDLPAGCLDAPVADQPGGVRRRIALACALSAGHAALLLEEPTRRLDGHERDAVHAALRAAAARGCAVLATWSDPAELLALCDRATIVAEGRSVADLPTALLDAQGLALLAAPPRALARSATVLADLTRENGGAAFWALRRDADLLCLDTAIADADADPGLVAGNAYRFDQTRIPAALARGATDFVAEPDGRRSTLLVPIRTRRGNPMGLIGLTVSAKVRLPPAAAIAFHIETLAGSL